MNCKCGICLTFVFSRVVYNDRREEEKVFDYGRMREKHVRITIKSALLIKSAHCSCTPQMNLRAQFAKTEFLPFLH